ncbi:hypothetical protein [Mycoplasma crocodyli]|nr:hypothetical protein [Mycoplasma crocodyli]
MAAIIIKTKIKATAATALELPICVLNETTNTVVINITANRIHKIE